MPNSSWNGQTMLKTLLANSSQNALTQDWKTKPACKDSSQKVCTNPKLENQSCLQEFKSEKNASLKIGKPTLLLTISSQKFTNNIERKNHVCNFACNRSNSECNNNIGKTICGAAEKRGIEKAYNFFFHKQILECHKNNHTEKKKKKKKAPSLNELLQDADQNTTGWREESGLGKLKSRAMHGFYVFMFAMPISYLSFFTFKCAKLVQNYQPRKWKMLYIYIYISTLVYTASSILYLLACLKLPNMLQTP